jgi:enoyl-CoA hydratase/carnithine racemase
MISESRDMQLPQTNFLELRAEGGILILTIDNPPNNYMPAEFFKDLHNCRELILSPQVATIIFTGKGKVFSKGADLQELRSQPGTLDHSTVSFANQIFTFISQLTKPVIAAINGPCFGGGLELALACHIRLCSEKARLGLPELSIGLIPGLGGIQRLIRVLGEAKALEMILLGDMVSASRALELNLVSRVFPKKDFFSKVLIFVRTLIAARNEALEEVLRLAVLSRDDKEEDNVLKAAESFTRLISTIWTQR